jgi:hypothetical protein
MGRDKCLPRYEAYQEILKNIPITYILPCACLMAFCWKKEVWDCAETGIYLSQAEC